MEVVCIHWKKVSGRINKKLLIAAVFFWEAEWQWVEDFTIFLNLFEIYIMDWIIQSRKLI